VPRPRAQLRALDHPRDPTETQFNRYKRKILDVINPRLAEADGAPQAAPVSGVAAAAGGA